jgi:hypothetical protein
MVNKTTLMIVVKSEDAEYFKKLQKEYKDEGKAAFLLFGEIIKYFKEKNKEF